MTGRDRITAATYQITLALYWTFHIHHNGLGEAPEILFPHGDPGLHIIQGSMGRPFATVGTLSKPQFFSLSIMHLMTTKQGPPESIPQTAPRSAQPFL